MRQRIDKDSDPVRVTILVSPALKRKAAMKAAGEGRSLGAVMRELLERYVQEGEDG